MSFLCTLLICLKMICKSLHAVFTDILHNVPTISFSFSSTARCVSVSGTRSGSCLCTKPLWTHFSGLFVKMFLALNCSSPSSHRASGTVFTAIDVATGQEVKRLSDAWGDVETNQCSSGVHCIKMDAWQLLVSTRSFISIQTFLVKQLNKTLSDDSQDNVKLQRTLKHK